MVLPSELQLGCLRVGVVEKLALVDGAILSFFWVLWGILYPILVNIALCIRASSIFCLLSRRRERPTRRAALTLAKRQID